MNEVAGALFRALHEGKWISIEYQNQDSEISRYWIAVKGIDPLHRRIRAEGFHIVRHLSAEMYLYLDRILSAHVLDGTVCEINQVLIDDIEAYPGKYSSVFPHTVNLRILDYLCECSRLDTTPYRSEYELIRRLDDAVFAEGGYTLDEDQFSMLVRDFQLMTSRKSRQLRIRDIGMNMLSIHTRHGLYVLSYCPLRLDIKKRMLVKDSPVICSEFTVNGSRESIRQFISEEDLWLLNDPEANMEQIRETVTQRRRDVQVDDMPYIIAVERNNYAGLQAEYSGIMKMYDTDSVTDPVKAFFGSYTGRQGRRRTVPFALTDRKINFDQLLAVNHAMRDSLTYVQGPPGTGKTQTIVNTILTAFFNGRTVLFASGNNHPIDGVIDKLDGLYFGDKKILFPALRLGNNDEILITLLKMKKTISGLKKVRIPEKKMRDFRSERTKKMRQLSALLKSYEDSVDLRERKEALETLLANTGQMNFQISLQTGQLPLILQKLKEAEKNLAEADFRLSDEEAEQMKEYLYYASYRCWQKAAADEKLAVILNMPEEEMTAGFNHYLSDAGNVRALTEMFPVIATTCISAHKIGLPETYFDMTVIDEASQCSLAVSLLPIIRGRSLLLVGDPQQLSPVILLDPENNRILRQKYRITDEYDYIQNSIYKTYLRCDAVSDEILLRYHYRCDPKIIGFSNRKYYNRKLKIETMQSENALTFIDVGRSGSAERNSSGAEADAVLKYIREHPGENIGIITPFVAQNELIRDVLKNNGQENVECGTVHAFQGDEKDTILFSVSVNENTGPKTYSWLKNNRELINVAVSRAKKKLVMIGSMKDIERQRDPAGDDLYELASYVRNQGNYQVTSCASASRALGIKPYSTETEEAFLVNLNHALENAFRDGTRFFVHKEVPVSQVFAGNASVSDYFYKGRFDFVVYQRVGGRQMPVLAVELDGPEHKDDEIVRRRDAEKEKICHERGFELIRVDNSYARRYHYMKEILTRYFSLR